MKPKTHLIYLSYLPQLSQDRFLVAPYGTAESEWPEVTSPSCCLALLNFHWQQIFRSMAVCTVLIFHLNENSTEQSFFFSRLQQSLSFSEFPRFWRTRRFTTAFTRAYILDPVSSKTWDLPVTALYRLLGCGAELSVGNSPTFRRSTSPRLHFQSNRTQQMEGGSPFHPNVGAFLPVYMTLHF